MPPPLRQLRFFGTALSRHCFLKTKTDFIRLLRQGKTVNSMPWRLYFTRGDNALTARFNVIIAKRHAGSAVMRNRLRRQLREAFRQECRQAVPPIDFLMRSVAAISSQDRRTVCADCRHLLKVGVSRLR